MFVLGAAIGAAVGGLVARQMFIERSRSLQRELELLKEEIVKIEAGHEKQVETVKLEANEKHRAFREAAEQILRERNDQWRHRYDEMLKSKQHEQEVLGATEAKLRKEAAEGAERERVALIRQLQDFRADEERLRNAFSVLSQQSLKSSREEFLRAADQQFKTHKSEAEEALNRREQAIRATIDPLTTKQTEIQKLLRELETARVTAYDALSTQAQFLQAETSRLTNTLANPQVRGTWGEQKLRQVMELAGLTAYVDFDEQVQVKFESETLRPDAVVRLPGKRRFPIDAKLPLTAFNQAIASEDSEQRKEFFAQHIEAVRSRIKELGAKAYFRAFDGPEFVVMFIPIEAAFYSALQGDPGLVDFAVKQNRVILCGPITLVSLCMSIAFGWREVQLVEGAREIAKLGRELVDRAATVADHAGDLSGALQKAVDAHNKFVNSLESRLLVTARRFQELGAGGTKEIPLVDEVLVPVRPVADTSGRIASDGSGDDTEA